MLKAVENKHSLITLQGLGNGLTFAEVPPVLPQFTKQLCQGCVTVQGGHDGEKAGRAEDLGHAGFCCIANVHSENKSPKP